jgi:hypothetical protein
VRYFEIAPIPTQSLEMASAGAAGTRAGMGVGGKVHIGVQEMSDTGILCLPPLYNLEH